MAKNGVDYSMGYDIASLKTGGVSFACRYIGFAAMSLPQDKIITYSEAYDLGSAGIAIVSNWEWTADRASIHNSFYNGSSELAFAGGAADAESAVALHRSIGGPDSAPIYFSIDFSTDGTDCVDYFKGVVSVLGVTRVGAYGPPAALFFLQIQGLVHYLWGWSAAPNMHITQTATDVVMGKMTVDTDESNGVDFGQWNLPTGLVKPQWFQYPICVPFGNTNFDVGLGGSHDLDVKTPPNMPVTSIVSGTVVNISAPPWGKQVDLLLSSPVEGHAYFSYLHLSAVDPTLSIGSSVTPGRLIGWVGGANSIEQYQGTTNPTGNNFINSPDDSSQVQVGIALHNGPNYGGVGWTTFPPIDETLDPSLILLQARLQASPIQAPNYKLQQFTAVWRSTSYGMKWYSSGLFQARLAAFMAGKLGACTPIEDEQTKSQDGILITNWSGQPIVWQRYDDGSHGEWVPSTSGGHIGYIYDALGREVYP